MKSKFIIFLVFFIFAIIMPHFIFAVEHGNSLQREPIIPGTVKGDGVSFVIDDSGYLNVTLTSSENVKVFLESVPRVISLNVEAGDSSITITELKIEGLEPNKTYYKYEDSYKNKVVFVSDKNGNYSWMQDLVEPHHIWFQEAPVVSSITKSFTDAQFVSSESTGPVFLPEQCADYGNWDSGTSTCTLNKNINNNVEITADNITLDCSNYEIVGSPIKNGIFLGARNGGVIKNCRVSGFVHGIYLSRSTNISVSDNIISDSYYALVVSYSYNNSIMGNNLTSNGISGSSIFLWYSYSNTFSSNNFIDNVYQGIAILYSSDNVFKDNNIADNKSGISIYSSYNNKIYHNNFVNNFKQAKDANGGDNFFDDGYYTGGNYWSDYTGTDLNNDGMGDMPYIFGGGQDNYPFMAQNGWKKPTKTPVLIVPGILGTELKKGDELLWSDIPRMAISISDDFMDPLSFNENLVPSDSLVDILDVIRSKTAFDYTEGLINEFKNQGYVENESLFLFPYDWRYGVSGKYADGVTNVDLLKAKIESILQETGASKIDIIAHSNGGLVVKKYVMDNPVSHKIDKAVFVGVPNIGAPKAVKALLVGDSFGINFAGIGLSETEMKKIGKNMPVSYDLLPSQTYYNVVGSPVSQIDIGYGIGEPTENDLSYGELKSYLNDKGYNYLATVNSENLHTTNFDNYDLRAQGIDLYNIVGCKTSTLTNFLEIKYKDILGNYHTEYDRVDLKTGDGTVPIESATNLPIDQANKFYILKTRHSALMSKDGSRQKIVNLISGSNLDIPNNLVTQDINQCQLNGKAISIFSPVDILVTDQDGNKLGLAEDGSIINEIPGADFEIWEDHKFLYLPQDAGQIYSINIQGTGTGTYTIKSQNIVNSQPTNIEIFKDLLVTPTLTGQINFDSNNSATLIVRQNPGDLPVTIVPFEISNNYIDKIAPEAVIQFDQVAKDIKFTGIDNITENSKVMVYDKDDIVILKDRAGNATEIKVKDKDRRNKMSAKIKSIKYNGVSADISKNEMAFSWSYDKNGNLKKLSQHVKSKKDYNITADYDGKNTKITGTTSAGKFSQSFVGLKVIKVTTNKGDLSWSY